jgi:pantoate--beta-alanine ligase
MKVFRLKNNLTKHINQLKTAQNKIGFVPTMGALHQGHLALVEASLKDNDQTVVSIFVNPTQFDNPDDLEKYPRTFETDLAKLQSLSDDIIVFYPNAQDFYDSKIESQHFDFDGLEHEMEGKHRPGHFDGVGTVVKKLFEVAKPDKAYFGEKDFQQLQIIKKLVEKKQMPIDIVPIPIYRENDGLAMSSRNKRLTKAHRQAAPFIYQVLQQAAVLFNTHPINDVKKFVQKAIAAHSLLELEYFEIADEKNLKPANEKITGNKYRGFIVVYAGDVRLIDNIKLS